MNVSSKYNVGPLYCNWLRGKKCVPLLIVFIGSVVYLLQVSSLSMLQIQPSCLLSLSANINPLVSCFHSGSHDGSRSADDLLHSWHWRHRGPDGTKETQRAGGWPGLLIIILSGTEEVLNDLPRLLLRGCESVSWRVLVYVDILEES